MEVVQRHHLNAFSGGFITYVFGDLLYPYYTCCMLHNIITLSMYICIHTDIYTNKTFTLDIIRKAFI